ncbi:eCIS core domain-containing protein [Streptacidiphilus melanogenes]|uniref:eCIS core domain-containing protein n=1 Tax=Streptacidiphilus melanogenes TaxID=411235 RepID=UPI0006934E0E|nr:DUF4157 domain-containing protein [Streptacidiphilus melanogenes]
MRVPAHDKAAADPRRDDSARSLRARERQPQPSAAPAGAAELLALQRAAGNAAVTRMLTSVQRSAEDQAQGQEHGHQGHDHAHDDAHAHEDRPVQRATAHQVLRSPGQPLQDTLRQEMEDRLGADFSDVRIHTDALAQRSAAEVGAHAYTSGNHVVLTDGGSDKHTLAHELTHVIQQRRGPVAGTDTGDGLRVSDPGDRFEREAEANATRVMATQPPVQRATAEPEGDTGTTAVSGGPVAVQRKGHEAISSSLPAAGTPRAGGLLGRLSALNKTQPPPDDAHVARIRASMADYDRDTNRDPMHCLMTLSTIQLDIASQNEEGPAGAFLKAARAAVKGELDVVRGQIERDDSLPEDARAPFKAMTDHGMLWGREEWADSAAAFHMEGPSYFRELSEMNRAGMAREIAGRGEQAWVAGVGSRLTAALQHSMLCHYTPRSRAEAMLGQGHVKSMTELLKANPEAENNTQAFDAHVLANEGFVFFYLELPNSPFRETRFGGEEPTRVEMPLARSPLMSQGWLMLSDFAQREYPTVRANPQDPGRTQSVLATREENFSPEFSLPVRRFDRGTGAARMDDDRLVEAMGNEPNAERRGQIPYAMSAAASDRHSTMTYGGAPGGPERVHSDRMRSNTLMGADIVPGLVERAIMEIQRIEEVNQHLAARLKSLSGDELLRFLLKDLLRPQAMLPNSVDLSMARVFRQSGEELHAGAAVS